MASDERLRQEGLLLEKEQRARHVAINMHGLKDRMRTLVDKHQGLEALDTQALEVVWIELRTADLEFDRLLKEIQALREDLGKPQTEIR
jgi:hypothetical protein